MIYKEDKVLREVHRIQRQMRKKYKGLSWEEEAREIAHIAQKIAKQHGIRIYPKEKSPYAAMG